MVLHGASSIFINKGIVVINFIGEIFRVNNFSRIDLKILINNNVDEAKA